MSTEAFDDLLGVQLLDLFKAQGIGRGEGTEGFKETVSFHSGIEAANGDGMVKVSAVKAGLNEEFDAVEGDAHGGIELGVVVSLLLDDEKFATEEQATAGVECLGTGAASIAGSVLGGFIFSEARFGFVQPVRFELQIQSDQFIAVAHAVFYGFGVGGDGVLLEDCEALDIVGSFNRLINGGGQVPVGDLDGLQAGFILKAFSLFGGVGWASVVEAQLQRAADHVDGHFRNTIGCGEVGLQRDRVDAGDPPVKFLAVFFDLDAKDGFVANVFNDEGVQQGARQEDKQSKGAFHASKVAIHRP